MKAFATGITLVLALAAAAQAQPTVTLSLVYQQSYDSSFGPVVLVDVDPGTPGFQYGPGVIDPTNSHVFDIMMSLSGLAPDQSFKYLQATAYVTGTIITPSTILGGDPFVPLDPNPTYDPPPAGAPNGGSRALFQMGNDGSSTDFVDLRWSTDALLEAKAAHGLNPGESGFYKIGELWISVDGNTLGEGTIRLDAAAVSTPFQVWTGGTSLSNVGAVGTNLGEDRVVSSQTITFGFPEPSTLVLATLAGLGLLVFRSRKRACILAYG